MTEKTMTPHDEMMEKSQAIAQWVLLAIEPAIAQSASGLSYGAPLKQVFARVVSVGPMCKTDVKRGDKVIFKDGVGIKELDGFTSRKYMFAWEPNILCRESDGSVATRVTGMTETPSPTIGAATVAIAERAGLNPHNGG